MATEIHMEMQEKPQREQSDLKTGKTKQNQKIALYLQQGKCRKQSPEAAHQHAWPHEVRGQILISGTRVRHRRRRCRFPPAADGAPSEPAPAARPGAPWPGETQLCFLCAYTPNRGANGRDVGSQAAHREDAPS